MIKRRVFPIACVLAVLLGGCVTRVTTSDGRAPSPPPRKPAKAPSFAKANSVVLLVGSKGVDTNGNGFPDRVAMEVYLFAQPYPEAVHEEGAFIVTMHPAGAGEGVAPLGTWRIEADEVRASRSVSMFGRNYALRVNLLDQMPDVQQLQSVSLRCAFEPADGRGQVSSSAVATLIGRRM